MRIVSLSLLRLRQALSLFPFLFLLLISCPISSISLDGDDSFDDHDLFLLDEDPSPIQSEGGLPLLAFKPNPHLFDEDEEILDHNKIDEYFENDDDENGVNYENIICAANGTCTDADPNACLDEHEECALWASDGECTANPSFMLTECAASCQSCDGPDTSVQCPMNETAIPAYKDGEMNAMFQQIADGKWDLYRPTILLRPGERGHEDFPWIVTLDEFLPRRKATCSSRTEQRDSSSARPRARRKTTSARTCLRNGRAQTRGATRNAWTTPRYGPSRKKSRA